MGAWGRGKDAGIFSEGRNAKGNDKKQSGEESIGF